MRASLNLFFEVMCRNSTVIGEVYRIPNTSEDTSIERFIM